MMNRKEFLRACAGAAITVASARSQQNKLGTPVTIVYKTVEGCEIKLDVYEPAGGTRHAAVMYIHGGALMGGSREQVGSPMLAQLLRQGYVIVSIDYRLAPETKVPGIIEDVQDAYRWMRTQGSQRFGINPDNISTSGGSAGGYLTLMTGFCLEPRPRSLVSYFGYGDIDGPWLSEPDEFYNKSLPPLSKEESWVGFGNGPVSERSSGKHGQLYHYFRQHGTWSFEVSSHDPHKEPKWFDRYCPIRNVTKAYPPTLLIHGTADTDVPYAESKAMAAKLAEVGVEHEFITVPGAGHGLVNAKPEDLKHATERSVAWIVSHSK
jgi:acetyl esterase/lipase